MVKRRERRKEREKECMCAGVCEKMKRREKKGSGDQLSLVVVVIGKRVAM